MIGPWKRLKVSWYRRKARGVIWFMRYIDVTVHMAGFNRSKIRQMWRDFIDHPATRSRVLDELAVVNKIRIKRERRSRLQMSMDNLYAKYIRAERELAEMRERAGELPVEFVEGLVLAIDRGESIDGLLGDYGITMGEPGYDITRAEEAMRDVIEKTIADVKREIPTVQP